MAENETSVADGGALQNDTPREVAAPVDQSPDATEAGTKVTDRGGGSREKAEDLSNHPQFRQMQSEYQKRLARMEQELQAQRSATEQILTRDMTDSERDEYRRSQEYQQFQAERQQLAAREMELQRMQDIMRLSQKSGAGFGEYDSFNSYDEAVDYSIEAAYKRGYREAMAKLEADKAKREANSVDLGGGEARTPDDEYVTQWNRATESGDMRTLAKLALQGRG